MATAQIDLIMSQVQQLSPEDQAQLIKRVADLLVKSRTSEEGFGLVYGKYKDAPGVFSTEEDFRLAEWRPTEEELDGP